MFDVSVYAIRLTGPAADEALRRLEEPGEHERLAGGRHCARSTAVLVRTGERHWSCLACPDRKSPSRPTY